MQLRYLQDANVAHPIHGKGHIVSNLEMFLQKLDEIGLSVTAKAAAQEDLQAFLKELKEAPSDSMLSKAQADELERKLDAVQTVLRAEGMQKYAFVTSSKRWDVERLLHDPGSLFGEGIYEELDSVAAYDFEEACKCIAFERPTAAVFHIMRGTEAVLRSFYCHIVKQKRLKLNKRMWGPMLTQLRDRSKPPPKALLDNLDSIRANFRNPTQHPDEIHTIDRAQDLLGLCIPVVNDMVTEMRT
jgi:hypothetical protein